MKLKLEREKFDIPPLQKVAAVLNIGLKQNYKDVNVKVVDCTTLKQWGCPAEGISGNEKIIDVGGEPYMHDSKFIGTEFDYYEISKNIGSEKSYALGAGSGAMSCLNGHCGELVVNENLITSQWNEDTVMPSLDYSKKNIANISLYSDVVDHTFITTDPSI